MRIIVRLLIRKTCLYLLFMLLCIALSSVVIATSSQKEAEQKLSKVQEQIRKSQTSLEKQRGELGDLEKQLREAEQSISVLDQKLNDTEVSLKTKKKKIASLQTEEKKLQKKLSNHQRVLYAQLRSEYKHGGQQKLKLLLSEKHPEKIGRDLIYYDYLHRARLHEIDKASEILQSVHQVRSEIQLAKERSRITQEKLLTEKAALEKAQGKRKTAVIALNNSVSSEKQKLENLKGSKKQLQDLIEKLRAAIADIPAIDQNKGFSKSKGALYWPVVGQPSNKFGQKRNAARDKLQWQGVFIPSKQGNNVRSIYHGRVAFAEWMRGLGLLVIVDHGEGYMSLYGHNQSLFKQVGEWVSAGEILANVGNSGGNNKTGLYFEIRKQGNPVNPAKWCTKAASSRTLTAK